MANVLLLHPGAMGSSLGCNLVENGHHVYWVAENRSPATIARAKQNRLKPVASLRDIVNQIEIVFSVCPPENAVEVGQAVAQTEFTGMYCDANAIAPTTAQSLLEIFGERYIDGGIVGPPPSVGGHTRLYLSGPNAKLVADMFDSTRVQAEVVHGNPLAASAVKMCYAAYTKGTAALILGIRALAEYYCVTDVLREEWARSQQSLWDRSERMGPGTSRKAWRFAPEMEEIAITFNVAGLPSGFHEAASEIYSRLATLKDKENVPTSKVVEYLLKGTDYIS